ncbi:helix-turn-helix domain-containing protein [Pleurocapsa sp. PCC 7327]|uniref:helix-turn-helix domain-containing protein n=1 Tax=Pleurocapsa sp. PCC 7327 TaxID=118163 RepID=UPI0002E43B17|nr:helix-turn-helix domain-containing protein [Pleurocapsa sp. PCC 7327]
MKPYSLDLRQKIVMAYENQEGSIRQLAKRFKVSPDCVRRLLKRFYSEGKIEPKSYSGGNQPLLQPQHLEVLTTLVEEDNDATLSELAQRLEAQTKLQVSNSTISRGIKKLNLTRKKNSQGNRSLYPGETTSTMSLLE